jgi:Chromo (CHRromatin Organisation MOdifier) domain
LAPCRNAGLTGEVAAQLVVQNVFRLHGTTPSSFVVNVVDRDKVWVSNFFREWCGTLGIQLKMSSAYHPQTDGQTERMNRLLEEVLRHYVTPSHNNWEKLLPLAEFAINSAHHSSTQDTPFRVAYGYQPGGPGDVLVQNLTGKKNQRAEETVADQTEMLTRVKRLIQAAQDRQKRAADKRRSKAPDYQVGQWVMLSTKTVRLITTGTPKLLPRWIGPFEITKVITGSSGEVAALRLNLPDNWRIHDIFHVSQVKPRVGSNSSSASPPATVDVEGFPEYQVDTILSHRYKAAGRGRSKLEFLVSWEGFGEEWNSWEPEDNLTSDGKYVNTKVVEYWQRLEDFKKAYQVDVSQQSTSLSTKKVGIKRKMLSRGDRRHPQVQEN